MPRAYGFAMTDLSDAWEIEGERLRLRAGMGPIEEAADDLDESWDDDLLHPPPRPTGRKSNGRTVFANLHVAFHNLCRRLEWILREEGEALSATEAMVLIAVTREPGAAIAVSRRETGLRPSTMTSVLARLERRRLVRREPSPHDHRFVAVWPTPSGQIAGAQARDAVGRLGVELAVHVQRDDLDGVGSLAEAGAVLGLHGTPLDY